MTTAGAFAMVAGRRTVRQDGYKLRVVSAFDLEVVNNLEVVDGYVR